MAKHKGHTGPIHHPSDMNDHLPPVKDMHIHESHRAGHKEHDNAGAEMMEMTDQHPGEQKGGKGMEGNESCCD